MAEKILLNEFKALSKEKWANIELKNDNLFCWTVGLMVLNTTSAYHGGYYKAELAFPPNYPYSPPQFKFLRPIFHPNIYPDGKLCISILHPPGEDAMSGESAAERWSPAQGVESVLISILSLLEDPEVSSPANVDAGVMLRRRPEDYAKRVKHDVDTSKQDIPKGFEMPREMSSKPPPKIEDDGNFWYESDGGESFGGSESWADDDDDDAEMTEADEDTEES